MSTQSEIVRDALTTFLYSSEQNNRYHYRIFGGGRFFAYVGGPLSRVEIRRFGLLDLIPQTQSIPQGQVLRLDGAPLIEGRIFLPRQGDVQLDEALKCTVYSRETFPYHEGYYSARGTGSKFHVASLSRVVRSDGESFPSYGLLPKHIDWVQTVATTLAGNINPQALLVPAAG